MFEATDETIAQTLKNNPRVIAALFALSMALMQAGNVAASGGSATNGP